MHNGILFLLLGALLLYPSAPSCGNEAEAGSISVKAVEGKGQDEQSALENAFREAIRQALGHYTLWQATTDGETYDEKIYLNADAVVSDYKVVGREERDGKVFLTIDAVIVRNEMMKYIQRIPSAEVEEGELANLVNKRKALDAAVKSLDLLFINWRQNLFRLEKYGAFSISPEDGLADGKIMVTVPFILTLNWDAYRVWRKKLMMLLDRIAVAKTTGQCKDFDNFKNFYRNKMKFFEENGVGDDNPKQYRALLFLDEWPEPAVGYTLYLVPFQIFQKITSILDQKACFRFSFSSAGGRELSKHSIASFAFFFQGTSMRGIWPETLGEDDECAWFRERTYTTRPGYGTFQTTQTLFHAAIPMSESSVKQIRECKIQCVPRENKHYTNEKLPTTQLSKAEWLAIDPNPGALVESNAIRPTSLHSLPVLAPMTEALTALQSAQTAAKLSKMENAWKALPAGHRNLLQKNVMWISCSMLLKHGNTGAVAKRKAFLDTRELEEAVSDKCHACTGSGHGRHGCRECGGTGRCTFCGGRGYTPGINGRTGPCPKCNSTGRCLACAGGAKQMPCRACGGSGRILSEQKCQDVIRENIAEALRICRGEE